MKKRAKSDADVLRAKPSLATAIEALAHGGKIADGFVLVTGYSRADRPASEVVAMEKAAEYGATAVFFDAGTDRQPGQAQAFIFISNGPADDLDFAFIHKRLWSWGGVPVAYRHTPGLVQLFRCRHEADFLDKNGKMICKPADYIKLAGKIAQAEAYWNAELLYSGAMWDDPEIAKTLLSREKAAHRALIKAVAQLHDRLKRGHLKVAPELARRLLILSLLIAYLDERGALGTRYFNKYLDGASSFADVLADGRALLALLGDLERKFNGGVFSLQESHRRELEAGLDLTGFQRLIDASEDQDGQLSFWRRYSFKDLPVELISHIYQMFVKNAKSSVYTPPALVRLLLDEALDQDRLDRVVFKGELIFDPACGSGIFLVEAFKRLVLHWRSRRGWAKPNIAILKDLMQRLRGTDLEHGAVELAAFSLSLALCDELTSEDLLHSDKLFPPLIDRNIVTSCFFEHHQSGGFSGKVGVIVGNPPFASELETEGSRLSSEAYEKRHSPLPDKQVAFLFLHDSMSLLAPDGILCMLQQYNFLYNPGASEFRKNFVADWDVREILDFVSIRGLFDAADTKAVAVIAQQGEAPPDRRVLHAVFRRTPRARADLRFEVDYYDLHWHRRIDLLEDSSVIRWRAGLLGGPRVHAVSKRLQAYPKLEDFARRHRWSYSEGFIQGKKGISRPADHIIGKPTLPSDALTEVGADQSRISIMAAVPIEVPRAKEVFKPPLLLIREQMDLHHAFWDHGNLTYRDQIVGFAGNDPKPLKRAAKWLTENKSKLQGYVAANSTKLFAKKATSISCKDIYDLPFPADGNLDLSVNEEIVLEDVALYYREFVRHGFSSDAGRRMANLQSYCQLLCGQINRIYRHNPLVALTPQEWPGMRCQPFGFGEAVVDWSGSDELKDHIDALLNQKRGVNLSMTRIARIYDGKFIYFIKPDRKRYWLDSIALRDADDLLSDLRAQGF